MAGSDSKPIIPVVDRTQVDHLQRPDAKLHAALQRFEEAFEVYSGSKFKYKGLSIPSLTVQQLSSAYQGTFHPDDTASGPPVQNNFSYTIQTMLQREADTDTPLKKTALTAAFSKAGDFAASLLPLAILGCSFGAALGDSAPIVAPLKAVANGTGLVLQLVQKERDRRDELLIELDRISYQSRRVAEIQALPKDSFHPLLVEKSIDLITEVVNFLSAALRYLRHGFFGNLAKSMIFGLEQWQAALRALHLSYDEYDQALLLQVVIRPQPKLEVSVPVSKEFLAWLRPSEADNRAQLMSHQGQRAQGTLQWILDLGAFKQWRLGKLDRKYDTPGQTLWITGLPGIGKSTISAFLYDALKAQYTCAALLYFFCRSGTPGLTKPSQLVRTICHQLIQQDAFYHRYLQHLPQLPPGDGVESMLLLVDTLLKDPITKGPDKEIFILLDGLDELALSSSSASGSYTSRSSLEALLSQLILIPNLKILATSRSSPELKNILGSSGPTHTISWTDTSTDVYTYVKERLDKSPKLLAGFPLDTDPVEYLGKKANGSFLWAALALDTMERAVSGSSFKSVLDEIPPTMSKVYDLILNKACQNGHYELIKEILGWILIIPGHFQISTLQTAVMYSSGDQILDMEDFLRSECGSMLCLVPAAKAPGGVEVHIGHETFQQYLTGNATSDSELFSPRVAHGKAALACLRCMSSGNALPGSAFNDHAICHWRWHLRYSMGIPEREFAEPLSRLQGSKPLPPDLARKLVVAIYRYLTSEAVDSWINHHLFKEVWTQHIFNEVYYMCVETEKWLDINRVAFQRAEEFVDPDIEFNKFTVWMHGGTQSLIDSVWARLCHAWVWNEHQDCGNIGWAWHSLVRMEIWAHHPDIVVDHPSARALMMDQEKVNEENEVSKTSKSSGKLNGNVSLRYANCTWIFEEERRHRKHFDAVLAAGEIDELSNVCQSNAAIGFREMLDKEESMLRVQESIDDDPDSNPKNYELLGQLYGSRKEYALALQALQTGVSRDPEAQSRCREKYYQLKVYSLTDEYYGCRAPDLDSAIALLEEAIREDPEHANSRWFHQMASLYEKKGDIEGARKTYRANMAFDPTWNTGSQWEAIANTYVNNDLFESKREFDWKNYCNVLLEAVTADPSYAHSYWGTWLTKGNMLKGYQHFLIAIDILHYGVEMASQLKLKSAFRAQAQFEYALGQTYCAMGRWVSAIPSLEDSVKHLADEEISYQHRVTLKALTRAYMGSGRWDDAMESAKMIAGTDKRGEKTASKLLGEIYLLSGHPNKAIKEYKQAIRLSLKDSTHLQNSSGQVFTESIGDLYLDLGLVYAYLSRPEQAKNCYQKAIPHEESAVSKENRLEPDPDTIWRSEGRVRHKLALLYELVDSLDERAKQQLEQAVFVFEKTGIFEEDDEFEKIEYETALQDLERVKKGDAWQLPTYSELRGVRMNQIVMSFRENWAAHLNEPPRRRQRGRG